MSSESMEAADRFHAHLDVCEQCEQHPFDLCPVGQKLLMDFGEKHSFPPRKRDTIEHND
jgi:hypothetical protein